MRQGRLFCLALLLLVFNVAKAQKEDAAPEDQKITKDEFLRFIEKHPSMSRTADDGFSQVLKETEPLSPQAQAIERFGEYPMDYSTGVPHISIPLYDIRLGNYMLPVCISYHASGIKVQDVASSVGLGWTLMAGGYIIRQEKSGVDKGFYLYKSEDEIRNAPYSPSAFADLATSKHYNTESDRYAYCFNGKSGVFRYAILDGSDIRTIPYTPLRIEENGSGYKITDTDGIRYYFMAEEKNRGDFTYGGTRETMAWYMTKIEFPDKNDSIIFKYSQTTYYYHQYKSEYLHQGVKYFCDAGEDHDYWTATDANAIGDNSAIHTTECSNMLLTEISWRGNKVTFNYVNDRSDHIMMNSNNKLPRLTSMTVKNYNGNTVRNITFDNSHYTGSTALDKRMFLHGITISGSSTAAGTEDYSFTYNTIELPNYFNYTFNYPSLHDSNCHEDYWGYYNGSNSTRWIPNEVMPSGVTGANRSVNQTYAKAGSLERITYPTGGYTTFTYESNRLYNGTLWGGLRLNSVISYNPDGTPVSQRSYQYSNGQPPFINITQLYQFHYDYWYYYREWINRLIYHSAQVDHTVSVSNPCLPLTGDYGFPIYYQNVTEFYGTSSNNTGKAVYSYLDDGHTSDYHSYEDDDAFSSEPLNLYSMLYNIDNGNISPLLTSKNVYENTNGNYTLSHSEQYAYEEVTRPVFHVGVRFQSRMIYIDLGGSNPYPAYNDIDDVYALHNVIAVPSFLRLARKTVKDNKAKVTTTTTYSYDSSLRTLTPTSEKVSSTSGDYYRTDYSYPFNLSGGAYANMSAANMQIPVESRLYRNGTLAKTVRKTYTQQNNIFVNTGISMAKGSGSLESRMQYTYDNYGNLTSAIKDGTEKTSFIWSYKRMYPVVKVEGLSISQTNAAASTVISISGFPDTNTPSTSVISSLATALSNAGGLVTAYTWNPLVGMISTQSPRGENTYFNYDAMGRLSAILDHGSNIIESYTYNYGTLSYVRRHTMTGTSTSDYLETTDFYDGIGRKSETVAAGQAPGGGDLVTLTEYDAHDRVIREWLPINFSNTGNYILPSTYKTAARPYYGNDNKPYSLTEYEGTPSGRELKQYGPGATWQDNAHAVEKEYTGNSANDVRIYLASNDDGSLTGSGTYTANQLYVTKTKDENSNYTYIFTDKEDRPVLERRMDGSTKYDTYYVYDIYGNLAFVLPPAASDALTTGTWSITSNATLKNYAYNYRYDSRNRCIEKKLPGCEKVTMTYDTADRLLTVQDGVQRNAATPTMTYYKYDTFGRQTEMGTKTTAGIETPLLKNYYDNYSFISNTGLNVNTSAGADAAFPSNTAPNARGMLTGTRVSQLNSPSTYSFSSFYYGKREWLVQSHQQNHLGGFDDEYYTYNYTGHPLTKRHVHSAQGKATQTELYTNTYDNADRLTNVTYKLNNNSNVTLSVNTYDAVARLQTRKLMNQETVTYSYNVRSWLMGISSTHFQESLSYNATNGSLTPTVAKWNGDISAIRWKAGTETTNRTYQFNYNALDWLTAANYSGPGSYSTTYTYDKMGNLLTLKRYGKQDSGVYGLIDNMTYTYTGNQPYQIQDLATDPTYSGAFNFNDPINMAGEYTYDKNGNLTKDLNKNISSIQYNFLNLPSSISYSSGKSAAYTYDATGRKLRVSYKASASATAVPTDYCGNMIYENGVLKKVFFDGGYVTVTGTPFYFYYLKDHQGNNRVVVNPDGSSGQVNHYYPFGGLFGESTGNSLQRFRFNGKEFDRTHGLDWYDYGARHMTPDVGRFTTIDPMAEKYYHISPYAYCANNPVRYVDVNGDSIFFDMPIIENGKINNSVRYTYGQYGDSWGFGRNRELYQGDNSTINNITNALNRIRIGGEVGSQLINYLSGKTGTNVLLSYGYNETSFNTNIINIKWNNIVTKGGIDVNGNTERPTYIGLAHELAHAYDMLYNGNVDESVWFEKLDGTPVKMFEKNASIIENRIRFENSLPQRAFYYSVGGKGFMPSQLPIFYNNQFINRLR